MRHHISLPFLVALITCVISSCNSSVSMGFSGTQLTIEGNKIIVGPHGDFQAALDRAKPGDSVILTAGATYKGAFVLPKKDGNDFVTITTSVPENLPKADQRIDPKKDSSSLPKLLSNVKEAPAIMTAPGASYYRFIGVEFGPTVDGRYNIIQIGTGEEKDPSELPDHIEFDRVYIHGDPVLGQRRGIAANGRNIVIKNSYISDIKRKEDESQAIAVWASDGPIEIINNYLEAAGENILFGGAGSRLRFVPSNCIVKENHLNKPVEWRSSDWQVKNLFEIKNGQNITVTHNLMTNNWGMAQNGMAVLFTTRADNGNATIIKDVIFSDNIVAGAAGGVNILGDEGSGGHRLTIRNNLFYDINGKKWNGDGHFLIATKWDGLSIENNTILQTGNITSAYGKPITDLVFYRNIIMGNNYGFAGDDTGSAKQVLEKYFPGSRVTENLIVGGPDDRLPGNFYIPSIDKVGFSDLQKLDLRVKNVARFGLKGTDTLGATLDDSLLSSWLRLQTENVK